MTRIVGLDSSKMPHTWVIRKSEKSGEYRAYFEYNGEKIWWTEGYSSKSAAQNAILSAQRNAPGAPVDDVTDELEQFKAAVVTSPDTVVTPDHASAEYREFTKALSKFADHLRTANDLQNLGVLDLEIAKAEVARIGEIGASKSFRAETLWSMTKSTAIWIAEKAADGAVKALAVAVLATAAKLLGISIL